MNSNTTNRIDGKDRTVRDLLSGAKFFVDYFQREYRWETKHMEALIDDLADCFVNAHDGKHNREDVGDYPAYYLGSVIFSQTKKGKSIIDGQQRITSLTLLLIYLKHRLEELKETNSTIDGLIFSEQYGKKSYNLDLDNSDKQACLGALFESGEYAAKTNDETVKNMVDRYNDISQFWPNNIDDKALPYFVDWLIQKVTVVEITAYSDDSAYLIFETMNDRGLNLTASEMLKSFVLHKIVSPDQRQEMDNLWKKTVQDLHNTIGKNADNAFFQAWFKGKYAKTIREGGKGSQDQDFEKIGRFHQWFRANCREIGLTSPLDFYKFLKDDFAYFAKWYMRIKGVYCEKMPHVYYIQHWGIADSLQNALLLSVIDVNDDEATTYKKLDGVAKFIETFAVRRKINQKNFGAAGIKNTFFKHIKAIRGKDLVDLNAELKSRYNDPDPDIQWDKIIKLKLQARNKSFVKHLLARVTSHVDGLSGGQMAYQQFHHPEKGKPYEIEHILGTNFADYAELYDDEKDFGEWRNNIGALALLPRGQNQPYSDKLYSDKVDHYLKENVLLGTLNPKFYENNPNFNKSEKIKNFNFRPYDSFDKTDIADRAKTMQLICQDIWGNDY